MDSRRQRALQPYPWRRSHGSLPRRGGQLRRVTFVEIPAGGPDALTMRGVASSPSGRSAPSHGQRRPAVDAHGGQRGGSAQSTLNLASLILMIVGSRDWATSGVMHTVHIDSVSSFGEISGKHRVSAKARGRSSGMNHDPCRHAGAPASRPLVSSEAQGEPSPKEVHVVRGVRSHHRPARCRIAGRLTCGLRRRHGLGGTGGGGTDDTSRTGICSERARDRPRAPGRSQDR